LALPNIGCFEPLTPAKVDYRWQRLFVRPGMTHEEYDEGGWKNDPWF